MPKHPPDPQLIDLVRQAIESGATQDAVAEMAHVARATVQRWCRVYGITPRTPCPPELAALSQPPPPAGVSPSADEPAAEWTGNSLEDMRTMQRDLLAQARAAARVNNYTAAQRAMRDAAALAPTIARVEAAQHAGEDTVALSRREIAEIEKSNRDLILRMLSRPLCCVECGRKLALADFDLTDASDATKA